MTRLTRSDARNLLRPSLLLLLLAGSLLPACAAPGAIPDAHRIFQWRPFLAPFHAVVLHFPIGFLTVAFLLELYRAARPSEELRRVTVLIVWLSLITAAISATFGLMRAGTGGYESRALEVHRMCGLAVPFFTLATVGLQHFAYRNESSRAWTYGYRTFLSSTLALVVVAGHFGGNLTHGSKYLVENAPDFVRELLDADPGQAAIDATAARNEKERVYTEKIQPILAAKCQGCHGPEKQKGGLRLDQPALALKGGESGKPAIKPGDPMESHLVRLILLPPHHDDVMPPDGKQPLSPEEIMTLLDWIRNGAAFPEPTSQRDPAGGLTRQAALSAP